MKKFLLAILAFSGALACFGQDSTAKETSDTIRIGGMVIIKKKGVNENGRDTSHYEVSRRKRNPNLSTNWWIVDVGFANLNDKTNYSSAAAQAFAPGFNKEGLETKTVKSINVNIWFFMQRLNLISHVVNLKYGLGLELNNYRFDDERVRFSKNPTLITSDPTLLGAKKNKLAADYLTVPFMLNFNFTPNSRKGFGLSAGVSAGFLYSARQKIKNDGSKTKVHDDFDLRKWKLSYIGELNLGPVRLYGSYAFKSMWEKGLDQTPYNVGIRFSHW